MNTEPAALYRLMAWLSPSFPVGAFSYSHGLEYAVEAGYLTDAASTTAWIEDLVGAGSGRNDAIFCACAHRAVTDGDRDALARTIEHAAAYAGTAELALETQAQGAAFVAAVREAWPTPALALLNGSSPSYPVAVGAVAAGHRLRLDDTLVAWTHAYAANLVSAAVRLVPLGQTDGQRITAALERTVVETARKAARLGLADAGSATLMNDCCSMLHETQYTRLFRS